MSERPSALYDARGLVIGWHGAAGPAVARFETASRERPAFVRGLGHAGADRAVTPQLFATPSGSSAIHVEHDGAWITRLSASGEARAPALVLPGVARIALAAGRDEAVLFGADDAGIVAVTLDAEGAPRAAPVRILAEQRSPPALHAARARAESVCVAFHRGAREWMVLDVVGSSATVVRHPCARAVEDARVRAVGGRAAVLLAGGGVVELALLGPGGRVTERPHRVFGVGEGPFAWPDAVWCDDHWTVLACDRGAERLVVTPVGDKGAPFVAPAPRGPFAALYRSQVFHVVEVASDAAGAELRLFQCARDGDAQRERTARLDDPHASARLTLRAIREVLSALADPLRGERGYRDRLEAPALSRDGTTVTLTDASGQIAISLRPDPRAGLSLVVVSALGAELPVRETPSSLVRLAAWVRGRLSPSVRAEHAALAAWAAPLAAPLGARVEHVARAGAAVSMTLRLDALPTSEALRAWLGTLRAAQPDAP